MPRGLKRQENSVQSKPVAGQATQPGWYSWVFPVQQFDLPAYWSPMRDKWLREFYRKPGNDLLVGTVATVVSKVETTGWYIEGPEKMAKMYQRILTRDTEFGAGWSTFMSKLVIDYLTQDNGAWVERRRSSAVDREGAALGFSNLDAQFVISSGDPEFPCWYLDEQAEGHTLHYSQVGHLVDMPSPDRRLYNVGFCALSRAAMTARVLMLIAKYKYERLSDLPPAGLLILNNLGESAWKDMQEKYLVGQKNAGNQVWRNVMIAFGLDPALKAEANLFEFSRLPEHFDESVATEIAVYSFALAFNIDPGDVWPRRNTPLGTASEANISHLKAKGKREGAIYSAIERFFNDGFSLPRTCSFSFDYKDADEDLLAAQIAELRGRFIRNMWQPPNNASFGGFDNTGGAPAQGGQGGAEGIITRDEARAMLVLEGLAPEWLLSTNATEENISDTGTSKSYFTDWGPRSRVYKSGTVVRLEHAPRLWTGYTVRPLTTESVVRALTDGRTS